MQHRHRYIVIQDEHPALGRFTLWLIYIAMFLLATFYFFGFFYWGTQELESERITQEEVGR